jgi:RHS repeat-associated protein
MQRLTQQMTRRARPWSPKQARILVALVCGLVAFSALPAAAQTLPPACSGFTDDPLQPGVTTVQAPHVTELRACVDALRAQSSLAATDWTDPVLAPQQAWIRAVHVVELRAALAAVYVARGGTAPTYTDPSLTAQSTLVRAIHITEIRQAILVVAGACPPETCGGGPTEPVIEYYHLDALGSVRVVTDEFGAVVRRHDFFPFGESDLPASGEDSLRFLGKEGDPETGLSYLSARYYRSRTGRFTTVDPGHVAGNLFNPQSWNAYAYAFNNPATLMDPTGLEPDIPCPAPPCAYTHPMITVTPLVWGPLSAGGPFPGGQLGNVFMEDVGSALSWGIDLGSAGNASAGDAPGTIPSSGAPPPAPPSGPPSPPPIEWTKVEVKMGVIPPPVGRLPAGVVQAWRLGRAGELAAGITKNTQRIASLTGSAAYRIPDMLSEAQRLLVEVKNVGYLAYTTQVRDFALWAAQQNYAFELVVRPSTTLSGPLQQAVSSGSVIIRTLP